MLQPQIGRDNYTYGVYLAWAEEERWEIMDRADQGRMKECWSLMIRFNQGIPTL